MLRSTLRDGAIAAAKSYAHQSVEPRHLLYAAARHLRNREGAREFLPLAKQALEPRGSSHETPELNAEATALLERLGSEKALFEALRSAFGGNRPDSPSAGFESESDEAASKVRQPHAPAVERHDDTVAKVLAELDALIGLESVKRQVRQVLAVIQANAERSKAGLPVVTHGLHLVFTGPPGTGKTTVARLIARLYACAGALPGSNFAEATRADLVAGYVGQTALKTADLLERARPGVLFIDEAYSLTPTHPSDFGNEAIATLVKEMEDHRQELAVIVAGYGDEMTAFVESNPGLRSRFKRCIAFPGYEAHELVEMFTQLAKAHEVSLGTGVLAKVERAIRRSQENPSSGNARFVRSLFEECYARMSTRAAEDGVVELRELQELHERDIELLEEPVERQVRLIGFGRDGTQ